MSRWCAPLWPNKPFGKAPMRLWAVLQYACEISWMRLGSKPIVVNAKRFVGFTVFLTTLCESEKRRLPWATCTLSLSLLLQTPRSEAKIRSRNFLGLRISESVDGPRHKLLIREPGQLRLDSGSLPAGWFPLPDAVGMLLGCHPSASRSLPSTSLEQLWDLGRLLSTPRGNCRGRSSIVTSTVREKQLCKSLRKVLAALVNAKILRAQNTSCAMHRVSKH